MGRRGNPYDNAKAGCCARAATGHAAAPPSSVMNSRRFIRLPHRRWASTDHGASTIEGTQGVLFAKAPAVIYPLPGASDKPRQLRSGRVFTSSKRAYNGVQVDKGVARKAK